MLWLKVVELWTKRNFRCDCGNSKFGLVSCKLTADKEPVNIENAYNQNFKGIYCTCCLPYPDPNAEEQVEMIQCCVCEDWFHENHLGLDSSEKVGIGCRFIYYFLLFCNFRADAGDKNFYLLLIMQIIGPILLTQV